MKINKIPVYILLIFLLLVGFIFLSNSRPASAQSTVPTPTPIASLPPRENNDQIDKLEARIQVLEERIIPLSIIMTILGLLGFSSPFLIRNWFLNKQKEALDNAFYKADPRNFPVYIPKRNFVLEKGHLEKLGFKNMREYEFLSGIGTRGIVICNIPGANFQDETTKRTAVNELKDVEKFIEDHKNDPYAFIIYIKGQLPEAGNLVNKYGNVVTANMPVPIANYIYTLARGLMD